MQAHFEDNPEDLKALQKAQREFKDRKTVIPHLKILPDYLIPDSVRPSANPVQEEIKRQEGASGNSAGVSTKKRRNPSDRNDLTQTKFVSSKKQRFTQEIQIQRSRRMMANAERDGEILDPERLPALSGRKLWELNHGKQLVKKDNSQYWGNNKARSAKSRKRKFPGLF